MGSRDEYERIVLEAAERGGLGVVVAHLAPPAVLYINSAATDLIGTTEQEIRRGNPFDFVVPEERQILIERVRRRLAGERLAPVDITILRGDGSRVAVECTIVDMVVHGKPSAVVFLAQRSVHRVRIDADVRYRALVDAAPDGVAITREGKFLYVNSAALALLGCRTMDDLGERTIADFMLPEDVAVMRQRTIAMVRTGARFPPRDYVVVRPGPRTVVEISSIVIEFDGAPAVLAFVRDVTEARRVQAELERAQRLTALGTMVAGVAHEVNNPLAFASVGAELLQRFIDGGCQDERSGRAALSAVTSGLERIATIVRDLRASVRSDDGEVVTLELSEVVASALRMTTSSIQNRASLDVALGELGLVETRPGRLEQVFTNLLINASQSFAGGYAETNVVRVRGARAGTELSVTVEDNGAGIAPQDLPKVFDPFFTTKAVGEGTGLGLAISLAIVTQLGGRIDIASTLGQGTRISVVLPLAGERRTEPTPDVPRPAVTPSRRRLLVVDDEPAIGRLLAHALSREHDIVVATSGVDAEVLLTNPDEHFDVVLCDLSMPDRSGIALFALIRERNPEAARRFALMTGGVFPEDALERARASALPRLEKPFSMAEVRAVIARIVADTSD